MIARRSLLMVMSMNYTCLKGELVAAKPGRLAPFRTTRYESATSASVHIFLHTVHHVPPSPVLGLRYASHHGERPCRPRRDGAVPRLPRPFRMVGADKCGRHPTSLSLGNLRRAISTLPRQTTVRCARPGHGAPALEIQGYEKHFGMLRRGVER